ncbi:50S ribosomal protein L7/L12 [Enterococcus faecalis]|uniref:50S ribosomal protein L7/L12 n=1 Tax=Enterococcus faecalis TaxID=1351 RepID=UPI002DBA6774|nr:50S ribosomal protein L7/L12 [Enterococcus faecalis]MEB7428226.1 50S ribosomal protein L7/L12 [Enterococcus faecalis]
MADILLRKLSKKTVVGLDDLATKKGVSREAYAKTVLASHVAGAEFTGERLEWEVLVKNHERVLSEALRIIQQQDAVIDRFLKEFGEGV